jgi:hypothetical protein
MASLTLCVIHNPLSIFYYPSPSPPVAFSRLFRYVRPMTMTIDVMNQGVVDVLAGMERLTLLRVTSPVQGADSASGAPREPDETEYLLASPANRERLLKAVDDIETGRNLVTFDTLEDAIKRAG